MEGANAETVMRGGGTIMRGMLGAAGWTCVGRNRGQGGRGGQGDSTGIAWIGAAWVGVVWVDAVWIGEVWVDVATAGAAWAGGEG